MEEIYEKTKKILVVCCLTIASMLISSIFISCGLFSNNNNQDNDTDDIQNGTDDTQNEQPSEPNNNHEFIELQENIIGTWEYFCNEQSLVEFGRPEPEYGLSKVNSALNKYIEDTGFTPRDECKGLQDDRYFIDRLQLRQGIFEQKFFFGGDNSLCISILFGANFQVYPAQLDYYYDASANLVEGKIGDALSVPNEIQQYEIFRGYGLMNTQQNGIILQTYDITFENMKLTDNNTLQLEYLRPGKSKKVILTFKRAQ